MISIQFLRSVKTLAIALVLSVSTIHAQEVNIIPYPNKVEMDTGVFNLSVSSRIYYDKECKHEAVFLQQLLVNEHKLKLQIDEKKSGQLPAGNIYLAISALDSDTMKNEEYKLKVDQKNIVVTGGNPAGVFYAIQSLRQTITNKSVPCFTVNDAPRFGWRAFMLDEGRYFKGEKAVKDILDEMALLKMNVFHWHLTDDQGWRIEIKKYPRLTEIGSKRKESETGTWLSNVFDGKPHNGFYTQAQIKEIIQYAANRHITIIPEIEMPGHASAAIAAYPWLDTENKPMEVPTSFGIKLNVYNVANKKVQEFLHDVLDEVIELFPSKMVHIGGDEVKYDHWKASKEVMDYIKSKNLNSAADLQIDFTNGISKYLEQHGHRMIGWNDVLGGLHGNNDSTDAMASNKLSSSAIIQFWTGDPEIVTRAALKGHDVINSYWLNTYLDYDYKSTPMETVYNFNPIPQSLPAGMHHKILGIGAQMWGEWIPTVKEMNYKIYPRIAAAAEVAWTNKDRKNFETFKKSLNSYLIPSWKKKGITILPEQLNTPVK